MLVPDADRQDRPTISPDVGVQQTEPLRTGTGNIELDAGEAGQVPAHPPRAERLAGHSPVGQVIERPASRGNRLGP